MSGGSTKFVFTPAFILAIVALAALAAADISDPGWLPGPMHAIVLGIIIGAGIVGSLHGIGLALLRGPLLATDDSNTGAIRAAVRVGRELERRDGPLLRAVRNSGDAAE